MTKIAVVVNKNWEAEGVISAIVNVGLRPAALPFPTVNYTPPYDKKTTDPRLKFDFSGGVEVTLWCIQDIMFHDGKIPPSMRNRAGTTLVRA